MVDKKNVKNIEPKIVNYVHLQIIHAETIKHENKYENRNKKYGYTFNPYCCMFFYLVYPLTEKPQNIHPKEPNISILSKRDQSKPSYQANLNPIDQAFTKEKFSETFKKHTMVPKEKYVRPQTANQEIGWYSRPLLDNRKWNRPVSSTPITQYVSDYQKLKGINPFSLPVSRISLK